MHNIRKPGRSVKACTNCRQQKLRCDASENSSKQCSRCRRLQLECVVLRTFKRVKKKTKAELQQEVELLRQQMSSATQKVLTADDTLLQSNVEDPGNTSPSFVSNPPPSGQTSENSPLVGPSLCPPILQPGGIEPQTTSPRSLNGSQVEAHKIDDCFSLYFSNYAHVLPIIDPHMLPDEYYSRCPLLFWTIVGVGSRHYDRDPTLLTRLAPSIQNMALCSLSTRVAVIDIIQSLLILSSWPFPFNSANKAMVHIFSGAAVNLAQQIGLHVVGVGQDFARVKLHPDESVKAFRAQLWHYCLIVSQSTSYADGLVPSIVAVPSMAESCRDEPLLSPDLEYRRKTHQVTLDTTQTMQQLSVAKTGRRKTALLNSQVEIFERELLRVPEAVSANGINNVYYILAWLHIKCFCFFGDHGPESFAQILSIYDVALKVIETMTSMDGLATVCTFYMHRMLLLAALCILKILRSNMHRSAVDAQAGESAYFAAIMFLRRMSVAHDDISARGADILAQLWASDSVFKRPDGAIDSLSLRIRSRLTISVVYDCMWWWREEIAGVSSPYAERPQSQSQEPTQETQDLRLQGSDLPDMGVAHPMEFDTMSYFGTEFDDLAEFSWTGTLD